MKIIKGLIKILTFAAGLICCNQTSNYDSYNIKGVWTAITNDSIYDEVIITDNDFYIYDEMAGDLLLTYQIESDSLKIFHYNGLQSSRKFKRIDKDNFIEQDSVFTVRFERLKINLDTSKVLSTKQSSDNDFDEVYYYKYINDLRLRRHKWDSVKNASR
jgi:hypothetical protein